MVSYVAPDASSSDSEILLHNLSRLSLIVHGKFISAADRYDGPSGGDLGGISTGIDVARDGGWHHVAVAWRSADGRVEGFFDGARIFDGGPYKTGAVLSTGGRLVLGQAQSRDCTSVEDVVAVDMSTSEPLECEIVSGEKGPGGLEAEVQHFRLWSKFVTADEVAQQMQEPFEGNSVGQVCCPCCFFGTGVIPASRVRRHQRYCVIVEHERIPFYVCLYVCMYAYIIYTKPV